MSIKMIASATVLSAVMAGQAFAFGAGGGDGSDPTFSLDGYVSLSGFDTFADAWGFTDFTATANFSLGAVDLSAGVSVDGYMVGGSSVVGAAPFVALHTNYGSFSIGGVDHASVAILPEVRIGASRFIDNLMLGPFTGYHRFIDMVTPVEENIFRYDGQFGDFVVSASHGEFSNSSIVAGYKFGETTVYAGVDGVSDFAATSLIFAIETSIGGFDITSQISTAMGDTSVFYSATNVSYEVMENLVANASVVTLPGDTHLGGFLEYTVLNGIELSAGYNDFGGGGFWSAGIEIPFGG